MMFSEALDEIVGQKSKVRILRLLLRSHAQLTGRDIARQTALNHRTCHTALRELASHGIVRRRLAGQAHLYELNEEHILVRGALANLFGAEQGLIEEYAERARRGLGIPVKSVILYGSVARHEDRPGSDVDLMFIVEDPKVAATARERLGTLAAKLAREFGSVPQIVFLAEKTFREGVKQRKPYFSAVLHDGQVMYGKAFSDLLKNGS